MFKKKPWSDALFPDFDDSFESRFYCFGGDGGGNKGGGGTPPPKENVYNPEDQEPERGRPTTTAPPPQKAEVYTGPFTSQIAEDIYKSGPERPPTDVQKDFGIANIAPQAVVGVGDVIDKKRLDNKTLSSFSPNMPEDNRMSDGLQKGLSSVYNQNLYNPEPSTLNLQNVYEEAVSPKELGVDFLGGTLSPDFNFKDDKYGFKYVRRFNQGGIVSLLQPLGDYLGNQIDQQRVDPFLEMVENAAYQEFDIKPDQGGGFFSGGFYKDGGGLPDRDLFGGGGLPHPDEGFDFSNPVPNMPPPLPAVQQPVMNTEPSGGPVASISNFGPDVGNGGLFGGGPMSGGTPTQLPGPRIPTFTGTGNDGFGSVSQGPLDFYNANLGIGTVQTQEPDYMMSAYNFFNPDPRGLQTGLPPQEMVRRAQGRLMQQDVKPPEVDAYLQHIIETSGRPTMEAPNMMSKLSSAQPLMGVLPGGEMVTGQPGPGFGLPSGNGPGGVTLRPGAPSSLSGFQGIETVGPGGLQLARTQFG